MALIATIDELGLGGLIANGVIDIDVFDEQSFTVAAAAFVSFRESSERWLGIGVLDENTTWQEAWNLWAAQHILRPVPAKLEEDYGVAVLGSG